LDQNTDPTWQYYGEHDPYFGVLTEQRFHNTTLDEAARQHFFETGRTHLEMILQLVRQDFNRVPPFRRTLDFGCGVGRVLVHLAGCSVESVGADISAPMLDEARRNCQALGIDNTALVQVDTDLAGLTGQFSLIHSYIVFQHIPPDPGLRLFNRLIDMLEDGGVAAIHFVYKREMSPGRRAVQWARRVIPIFNGLVNRLQKQPARTPYIPMYAYPLEDLFGELRKRSQDDFCGRLIRESSKGVNSYGILLLVQKNPSLPA
jgi:SAM-dependent methyltransferase